MITEEEDETIEQRYDELLELFYNDVMEKKNNHDHRDPQIYVQRKQPEKLAEPIDYYHELDGDKKPFDDADVQHILRDHKDTPNPKFKMLGQKLDIPMMMELGE